MSSEVRGPSVVVVGAGFGGLGVGIELLRAGITDLTILEKADDVGGVWRDNTIAAVEPAGLRTADGEPHEADVLVWGTGFAAAEFLSDLTVTGVGGHGLHELWREGAFARLGMTVPGFPNLFLVYGPNTNLGGSSILGMLEAQARYIRQAVRVVATGLALDVRPEVAAAYDVEVQQRLAHWVWSQCAS